MSKKLLSAEEVDALRNSPFVEGVIGEKVSFTPEFKRMAYVKLSSGMTMREILSECGIEPKTLGDRRIWGLTAHIREMAERDTGFTDLRKNNSRKPANKTREQSLLARIELLEHQLEYTQQEVEFLKKIRMADLEAQKSWESKQPRK